jgi:hypothetical protein
MQYLSWFPIAVMYETLEATGLIRCMKKSHSARKPVA